MTVAVGATEVDTELVEPVKVGVEFELCNVISVLCDFFNISM
jgi:hypothetical protein